MKQKTLLILGVILLFTIITRWFGQNWDQGYHLHPDERAIILFTIKLHFPSNLSSFFSADSPWNPHFFAYGSLPLYLLFITAQLAAFISPHLMTYDGIQFVGRNISALADVGIVFLLFYFGKKFFSNKVGLLSAAFYSLSTFALQASHFFAVDTLLTFFILACITFLCLFVKTGQIKKLLAFAMFFGFALSTKISAILLLLPLVLTLLLYYIPVNKTHKKFTTATLLYSSARAFSVFCLVVAVTLITFTICEPYAFISFSEFWQQTQQQSEMTKSAWTFPYTLQYVTILPYFYELQQIFFWGQGPLLSAICILGVVLTTIYLYKHPEKKILSIVLSFFWLYFAIVGGFAVAFMRYMLPVYPLLCICGALGMVYMLKPYKEHTTNLTLGVILVMCSILPVSFLHIYTQDNTRTQATNWILSHIPSGKHLAIEHWDDQLPLAHAELYPFETLELYNVDSDMKWQKIHAQLATTDYIILASNRLYTPLQKLTDCKALTPHPCYAQTAKYYQQLFSDKLGFSKVADFTSSPTIPVLNLVLNDQSADESFTVYDHPQVMIFKKN